MLGDNQEKTPVAERDSHGEKPGEKVEPKVEGKKAPEKPSQFTWDRTMEILKVVATVWAAVIGTFVTMQFNERQHELARIEAIAQMLPHLAEPHSPDSHEPTVVAGAHGAVKIRKSDMTRDGAIWAIFRTANNKVMLRDLASLFPEDIYRVVSSIAVAGTLQHDDDAMTALQVASEKLAAKYSDDKNSETAARLYNQALRLKQRKPGEAKPIYIVDLSEQEVDGPLHADHEPSLLSSINQLGDLHAEEGDKAKKINAGHWQAKQLYKRVRKLGGDYTSKEAQLEVAKADIGLFNLYRREGRLRTAQLYLKEALKIQEETLGKTAEVSTQTRKIAQQFEMEVGKTQPLQEPAVDDGDDDN